MKADSANIKRKIVAIVLVCIVYFVAKQFNVDLSQQRKGDNTAQSSGSKITIPRKGGSPFAGTGKVIRVFPDDNVGIRHQRFILKLPSGKTIMIAHNIDLAPRVSALRVGDTISFSGIYEENSKGGVVHWTHRDPRGRHRAGWLKKN